MDSRPREKRDGYVSVGKGGSFGEDYYRGETIKGSTIMFNGNFVDGALCNGEFFRRLLSYGSVYVCWRRRCHNLSWNLDILYFKTVKAKSIIYNYHGWC